jgi:hypothetical protein
MTPTVPAASTPPTPHAPEVSEAMPKSNPPADQTPPGTVETSDHGDAGGVAAAGVATGMRRQAHAAEAQLNDVVTQLRDAERELTEARRTITALERREKIGDHLRRAGAIDLDVARLLTEVAIADMDEPDVRGVIDDLRRHKPYLFASGGGGLGRRSMGPRVEPPDPADAAADQAGQTGDRRDLMTYLRLRRQA